MAVSLSHEVLPEMREYERTSATVMNAFVQPLMGRYLRALESGLNERGFAGELHLMTSSGGTVSRETAEAMPIQLVESGPAAGAFAAMFHGKRTGHENVLSFDMGGTTAKAAIIKGGRTLVNKTHEVARVMRFKKGSGLPVGIPVLDMIEIGAGGGSIAEINDLGLLQIGPAARVRTRVRSAAHAAERNRRSRTPTSCWDFSTRTSSWAERCRSMQKPPDR